MDSDEKLIELKGIAIRLFAKYGLLAPVLMLLYPIALLQYRVKLYFQNKINETQL
jgi:hypothetical protein